MEYLPASMKSVKKGDDISHPMQRNAEVWDNLDDVLTELRDKLVAQRDDRKQAIERVATGLDAFKKDVIDPIMDRDQKMCTQAGQYLLEKELDAAKSVITDTSQMHKEIHGEVTRIKRAIDGTCCAAIDNLIKWQKPLDEEERKCMAEIISDYLAVEGEELRGARETLDREAGIHEPALGRPPFANSTTVPGIRNMAEHGHTIGASTSAKAEAQVEDCSMEDEDIDPVRTSPQPIPFPIGENDLEADLEKLRMVLLLQGGKRKEAIAFARTLPSERLAQDAELQSLMRMTFQLLNDERKAELEKLHATFESRASDSLLSGRPLYAFYLAGSRVCSHVVNMRRVIAARQDFLTSGEELPISIVNELKHSVLTCPILRQQCTMLNPPRRLGCGHVISSDAMNKLALSSRHPNSSKLKCPYCPNESITSDSIPILF